MSAYINFLKRIPEVVSPLKKMSLKQKLLWTFGIVVLYLFLATIPIYGVLEDQANYFKTIELLLGAKIGKLLTLGIGPIVTSSIILQLLKGSGIINFNLQTEEGKFVYSGTQKLLTFFFIIVESFIFINFGVVSPSSPDLYFLLALQLMFGGFIIVYMDEVVKKWGFGSGVSLFIAASIGQALMIKLISPFTSSGAVNFGFTGAGESPAGVLWSSIHFLSVGDVASFITQAFGPLIVTIGLFFLIVFLQSTNVHIPLSFGRIRGQTIKWPLNYFYSGVIPVILVSAFGSNIQLWARGVQGLAEGAESWGFTKFISKNILGQFDGSTAISGLVSYIRIPDSIFVNFGNPYFLNIMGYTIFFVTGTTLFSYLWVQTSGQDARGVAKQIINSGLQIPGFRRDGKIIEKILARYIKPLTTLGGISIGLLAVFADILGALETGTGILLMIMIIYQFYQSLARESMEDFSMLRSFMRK